MPPCVHPTIVKLMLSADKPYRLKLKGRSITGRLVCSGPGIPSKLITLRPILLPDTSIKYSSMISQQNRNLSILTKVKAMQAMSQMFKHTVDIYLSSSDIIKLSMFMIYNLSSMVLMSLSVISPIH